MILHLGPNLFQCIRVGFYFFFLLYHRLGGESFTNIGDSRWYVFFFLANRTDSIACILKKSMLRRLCFEVLFCYFGTTAGFFIFRPVVKPVRRWLRKVAKTISNIINIFCFSYSFSLHIFFFCQLPYCAFFCTHHTHIIFNSAHFVFCFIYFLISGQQNYTKHSICKVCNIKT